MLEFLVSVDLSKGMAVLLRFVSRWFESLSSPPWMEWSTLRLRLLLRRRSRAAAVVRVWCRLIFGDWRLWPRGSFGGAISLTVNGDRLGLDTFGSVSSGISSGKHPVFTGGKLLFPFSFFPTTQPHVLGFSWTGLLGQIIHFADQKRNQSNTA